MKVYLLILLIFVGLKLEARDLKFQAALKPVSYTDSTYGKEDFSLLRLSEITLGIISPKYHFRLFYSHFFGKSSEFADERTKTSPFSANSSGNPISCGTACSDETRVVLEQHYHMFFLHYLHPLSKSKEWWVSIGPGIGGSYMYEEIPAKHVDTNSSIEMKGQYTGFAKGASLELFLTDSLDGSEGTSKFLSLGYTWAYARNKLNGYSRQRGVAEDDVPGHRFYDLSGSRKAQAHHASLSVGLLF